MNAVRFMVATAASVAATAIFPAVPLRAEVAQKDGVRVSLSGALHPRQLPRRDGAPVSLSIVGRITPTKPGKLPKLKRVRIGINRYGRLDTRSVPVCRPGEIDPSTTAEALAACAGSLVGDGRFSADVRIPDQSPFPSRGRLLAFNGKFKGEPAILAHIYGTQPVQTSYVLPFKIEKARGTFGTVLSASLPRITGEWGFVTGISLDLDRRFLSARCAAPPGFPSAVFPLLRASFDFDAGPTLTSTLNRSCKVR